MDNNVTKIFSIANKSFVSEIIPEIYYFMHFVYLSFRFQNEVWKRTLFYQFPYFFIFLESINLVKMVYLYISHDSRNFFAFSRGNLEYCIENTCQRFQNLEKFGEIPKLQGVLRNESRKTASRKGKYFLKRWQTGERVTIEFEASSSKYLLDFFLFPLCKKEERGNCRGNSINLAMLNVISKRKQRAGAKQRKKGRYLHNGRLLARSGGVEV